MAFWPGLITLGLEPHSQDVAGDDPSVTDSPSICLRCNASGNVMPKRTSLGSRSIPEDPQSRKLIEIGRKEGGIYVLDELRVRDHVAASRVDLSSFRLDSSSFAFYLWHSRVGHVLASHLKFLVSSGVLGDLQIHDIFYYSGCKLAKFSTLPFTHNMSKSVAPFDLIHFDVLGAAPIDTRGGI
ncbi:uncharacterized protein LOC131143474 isoform X1 [Malania oleifera]|uniref:uncharacterized protein LOC131143474 isoform X1 n=1 Tax=Malania oleifera TaxID=397392 RepID=UPI0025AE5420|nr:uncharacterized protein LOC131143474 isoform X1 [Malania oleifera]